MPERNWGFLGKNRHLNRHLALLYCDVCLMCMLARLQHVESVCEYFFEARCL